MYDLEKVGPATYRMRQGDGMRVPGLIFMTDEMLHQAEVQKPLGQVRNVAHLPGIVGHSIAMPDIHWGYGFPIGGVAAMDVSQGVISPGGVGYDINCGVRLAVINESFRDLIRFKKDLLRRIFELVPSGVGQGRGSSKPLSDTDYQGIAEKGARWSIDLGLGLSSDLEAIESRGVIDGGDLKAVSQCARERGAEQLGSIGSGNHFVEVGEFTDFFLPEVAGCWEVEEGQTYVMIHSGSRGFGHQICQDALGAFIANGYADSLPDKQLVAAPITSPLGRQYLSAMAVAANFAFNNRQQILHLIRSAFFEMVGIAKEEIRSVYDVCHNIAKFETHEVDGEERKLCVHRKGATRAFGPGAEELAPMFRETGQPVLVPGDMGTASYLMVGCGAPMAFSSACHGAGRARSRISSAKAWKGKDPIHAMHEKGVEVMASSKRTIVEEMPDAYKDVDEVVLAAEQAGLAKRVARLRPRLVIKG